MAATDKTSEGPLQRRFISIKEGARYLGVCDRFLYGRIGSKLGPPFRRIGRKIALPRKEFIEWAEQQVIR